GGPRTGPYRAGSWACCEPSRVPLNLYDPGRARSHAAAAVKRLGSIDLTLKYPDDDPRVRRACEFLCQQVEQLKADIRVKPVPLSPRKLREAIETRDYQLAYH